MEHFTITGAELPRSDGTPPPKRLEINTFVKDDNIQQFSLFVQAFCKLMLQIIYSLINCILAFIQYQSSIDDPASYYQMSGIHRLPFIEWSGSGSNAYGSFGGHCTHATVLFPTWQRPYVALFEVIAFYLLITDSD
jgi:tyrosinase